MYTLEEKKMYFKALFVPVMDSLPLLYRQRVKNLLEINDEGLLQKYYDIIDNNIDSIRWSIQSDVLVSIQQKEWNEKLLEKEECEALLWLLWEL